MRRFRNNKPNYVIFALSRDISEILLKCPKCYITILTLSTMDVVHKLRSSMIVNVWMRYSPSGCQNTPPVDLAFCILSTNISVVGVIRICVELTLSEAVCSERDVQCAQERSSVSPISPVGGCNN